MTSFFRLRGPAPRIWIERSFKNVLRHSACMHFMRDVTRPWRLRRFWFRLKFNSAKTNLVYFDLFLAFLLCFIFLSVWFFIFLFYFLVFLFLVNLLIEIHVASLLLDDVQKCKLWLRSNFEVMIFSFGILSNVFKNV
jgi:hypothetical protein